MKCCILAIGGAGEQAARALMYAALAGVVDADQVDVLLVDTDTPRAELTAWCADYQQLQALWKAERPGHFRTMLTCRCWPETLPDSASTLRKLAQTPEDALLLQSLLDEDAADADLRRGFHGRSDVGGMIISWLLHQDHGRPQGALETLMQEAEGALETGEDVRMVLVGSAMGGLGAAGLTMLAHYLQQRIPQAQTAAVVLLPYFRGEDTQIAQSRVALQQWVEDGLCETVYLLGLEQGAYLTAAEGHQQARMPEWLAALCAVDFFRSGRKGMYGWRTALDRFDWDAFGDDAVRLQKGYTELTSAALSMKHEMAEVIRRGLTDPRWLRDKLIGWYAQHFMSVRKMSREERDEIIRQLDTLQRLLNGYLTWLDEVIASLPPQLRTGSQMDAAIQASQENYDQLVKLDAQLAMLRQTAERMGLVDSMVHRGGLADPEQEQMSKTIAAAEEKLHQLEMHQQECLNRTGGQAYVAMLRQMDTRCKAETAQFRAQTEEAAKLIRQAEENAADPGRIATARTKLKRMEQSLVLLEGRCHRVSKDLARARTENLRMLPPQVGQETAVACGLFPAEMLGAVDRKNLETVWPKWQQLREKIAVAPAEMFPMAGFVAALMGDEGEGI